MPVFNLKYEDTNKQIDVNLLIKKINSLFCSIKMSYKIIVQQEMLDFVKTRDFCESVIKEKEKIGYTVLLLHPEYDIATINPHELNNFLIGKQNNVRVDLFKAMDDKDFVNVWFYPEEEKNNINSLKKEEKRNVNN